VYNNKLTVGNNNQVPNYYPSSYYQNNENRKPNENTYHNNSSNQNDYESKDKYLSNGKYTCKFYVQIDNDNEFQVARRLIGAKGCNMKKIVELCSKGPEGNFLNDAVKLRLRGRGSGYKEGPMNKESEEPLHLCISSKFLENYKGACGLVQELLTSVYDEYKKFLSRSGRHNMTNFTIQKEENISTRRGGY